MSAERRMASHRRASRRCARLSATIVKIVAVPAGDRLMGYIKDQIDTVKDEVVEDVRLTPGKIEFIKFTSDKGE